MSDKNTIPCPKCRTEVEKPDPHDWEFQDRADGANHWRSEMTGTCPGCDSDIILTFLGVSPGHPDNGEPIEQIEMVDIELVEEPLVRPVENGIGIIRQADGVMIDDPEDRHRDDMACYCADAVSLRSCLTCGAYDKETHHCPKIDAFVSASGERMRTGCGGWDRTRVYVCEHRDHCDGPCPECHPGVE